MAQDKRFFADQLAVQVAANRDALGALAAADVAACMRRVLQAKSQVRMIFAAAPSQSEFLRSLIQEQGVDWARVIAFQMDEYTDLPPNHPSAFQSYLHEHLFQYIPKTRFHRIDSAQSPEVECERYGALVMEAPIDIVCLGIGENGHIAFNDPGVAKFDDPCTMKRVELDLDCRLQQVHDGCFSTLTAVPEYAVTLTIPTLTSGAHLFCIVPGPTKRVAVHRTLHEPISEACPASVLRRHPDCNLYVDSDSIGMTHHG